MARILGPYSAEALRSAVGLVLQDPFLFHGTIASNIRTYYQSLTDEAMRRQRFARYG